MFGVYVSLPCVSPPRVFEAFPSAASCVCVTHIQFEKANYFSFSFRLCSLERWIGWMTNSKAFYFVFLSKCFSGHLTRSTFQQCVGVLPLEGISWDLDCQPHCNLEYDSSSPRDVCRVREGTFGSQGMTPDHPPHPLGFISAPYGKRS